MIGWKVSFFSDIETYNMFKSMPIVLQIVGSIGEQLKLKYIKNIQNIVGICKHKDEQCKY